MIGNPYLSLKFFIRNWKPTQTIRKTTFLDWRSWESFWRISPLKLTENSRKGTPKTNPSTHQSNTSIFQTLLRLTWVSRSQTGQKPTQVRFQEKRKRSNLILKWCYVGPWKGRNRQTWRRLNWKNSPIFVLLNLNLWLHRVSPSARFSEARWR